MRQVGRNESIALEDGQRRQDMANRHRWLGIHTGGKPLRSCVVLTDVGPPLWALQTNRDDNIKAGALLIDIEICGSGILI